MPMKNIKTFLRIVAILLPTLAFADSSTDRKIETTLSATYNYRTVLDNQVKVQAHDGAVTLTGTVLDDEQKTLAEDTARDVPGVVSVENQLEVANGPALHSDGWIALKLRTSLLVHANVSAAKTHVDVHDGVVTLTGTADSMAQKELTEAYVSDVDGVKSVKNDLQVASAPEPATRPSLREMIDDTSITAQVKYSLLTHRSTSALKTEVETHDGNVVIKGTATSDAEKDLVTKLARTVRGVASVDNEMKVTAAE